MRHTTGKVSHVGERMTGTQPYCVLRLRRLFAQNLGPGEWVQQLTDEVVRLAESDADLLILGETGTPKHLIARGLHECSERSQAPFVVFDCTALPKDPRSPAEIMGRSPDMESESADTPGGVGLLQAQDGTAFLDHVESLSDRARDIVADAMSARRAAESPGKCPFRVRIIAGATCLGSAPLPSTQLNDAFGRHLLLHTLTIPPLRERPEDLLPLADRVLQEANLEMRKSVRTFSPDAQTLLLEHSWPGNYAELRSVVYQAVGRTEDVVQSKTLRAVLRASEYKGNPESRPDITRIIRAQSRDLGKLLTPRAEEPDHPKRSLAGRLLAFTRNWRHPASAPEEAASSDKRAT